MAQPNKYRPEYAQQCHDLCLLGLTDRDLAKFFKVALSTIDHWAKKYPEFGKARAEGKEVADAQVARSLFKRAKGGHKIQKAKVTKDGEVINYLEEVDADVRACETWLASRRGTDWNPKQQIEHSGNVQTDLNFILDAIDEEAEHESPLAHGGEVHD